MPSIDAKQLATTVGRGIANQRTRCGMTQEEVAEKLDIGYEAVSRIERGVVMPNIVRLAELAEIFDCSLADLLTEISPQPRDQANHLAQLLDALPQQDREWVVQLVEELVARLNK